MDLARLGLQVDSSDVRTATNDLSRFGREGKAAAHSADTVGRSAGGMGGAFKGAALQIAGAVGAFASVQKALGAAEQYTTMQNRLLALGASHESASAQIQQLADIAKNTRAPLESTVELYSRLSLTADSLGASQAELMQFTETVGLALAASGTSAGQASGALTQLSQAMAGGVVRAEEFNSIIEGAPGLLMAVANGMDGVNGDLGALRQLMLDGELTSEAFFDALLSQTEALETAFGNTTPTISSALGVLSDQFTLFIGGADQATGVTSAIADAILILAENMDVAVPVFGAVAVGVAAISAPILAAGVAIGALAVAVITHWDEIEKAFGDGVDYVMALGPRLVQALKDAGAAALDAALNIGVEIINGISAGIDRKFQDLKDKITGLGVYLPEWLKDMLGIASPSKVFAEIGEWTVEGLIVGMDDREDALRTRAETLGATMGEGIKDGLDPVLRTVFDGLARGDLGSIGSGLLGMAQQGFSNLLQTSFAKGGSGLSGLWEGITGGFANIGANYRGAGGGLAGIGSALSGLLPGIGAISSIVGVVQSVIGTTTKLTNALEGTLGIGGLLRGSEYDIKQKDNIFGSKTEKNSEEIFGSWAKFIAQDLDTEFRDMVQTTRDGIRALGLDINEAFTYDFDVQFDENLPHEQLMERLRSELDRANDELLRTSLAAAGLARDGETGAQTLVILNDSLRAANASLRLLDQTLFDVSAIGAGAARELVEVAGGLEAFAAKTTFVFENFLTEGERDARALAIANENLAQTFDQLVGISIPETHAQFMALLDAQDLTTAAGRETYAALLDVADEFVTVNGAALGAVASIEEVAETLRTIPTISRDALRAISDANVAAYQSEVDAQIAAIEDGFDQLSRSLNAQIELARDAVDSARGALDSLTNTISGRTPSETFAQTQARTDAAVARLARAVDRGVLPEAEALERILSDIGNTPEAFETREDYLRSFYQTNAVLNEAQAIAENTLTVEERMLAALEQRLADAQAQTDSMVAGIEEQARAIANLPASLAGVLPTGELSLDALNAFFNDSDVLGFTGLAADVNDLYREVLGRNADLQGLNFYLENLANGSITLADVAQQLETSVENILGIVPGFADAQTNAIVAQIQGQISLDRERGTALLQMLSQQHGDDLAAMAQQLAALMALPQSLANVMPTGSGFDGGNNQFFSDADVDRLTGDAAKLAQIYEDVLGRNPDLLGLNHYLSQLTGGRTLASIEQEIRRSTEAVTGVIPGTSGGTGQSTGGGTTGGGAVIVPPTQQQQPDALAGGIEAAIQAAYIAAFGYVPSGALTTWSREMSRGMSLNEVLRTIYGFAGMSVPSYAVGTDFHPGGLAYVHKDELINLPRGSSVTPAAPTRRILDNSDLITEVRELRREVAALRSDNNRGHARTVDEIDRQGRPLRKWDVSGLPAERVTT